MRFPLLLQQACGFEYTSKLQRMFQDVGVSKDLNEQFKKHLSATSDLLDSEYIFSQTKEKRSLVWSSSLYRALIGPSVVARQITVVDPIIRVFSVELLWSVLLKEFVCDVQSKN